MAEEVIAAIIGLGVLAAVFLPLGICPLVICYRLTHGLTAAAAVEEHVLMISRSKGHDHYSWHLKLKYYANGLEHIHTYGVSKKRAYLDAHPVGTEMKILVNIHNPKRFILPEDKWIPLLMGVMFTLGGAASLIGVISLLISN